MDILRSKFGPALHHNEHQHKKNVSFLQFHTFLYESRKRNVLTFDHFSREIQTGKFFRLTTFVFQVFPVLDKMSDLYFAFLTSFADFRNEEQL